MAVDAGCMTCHLETPAQQTGPDLRPVAATILKRGSSNWCRDCHSMDGKAQHPAEVKVADSKQLPLEEGGLIDCITCHSPHRSPIASEPYAPLALSRWDYNNYNSFLLNSRNDEGQLCARCHEPGSDIFRTSMHSPRAADNKDYVGSKSCAECHVDIYEEWKLTPHARMARRFSQVEDMEHINLDELEWPREQIAWVLGSHYVHRFVAQASGSLIVLPKIWDRHDKKWLPVNDYGWRSRYWLEQCAGCHTTGFSAVNESFVEPGVGCEACHGPGLNHTRTQSADYIVKIRELSRQRQEMVCMSCHTSGIDETATYHFPVGYRPGEDLTRYFSGLTPKPGQTPANFAGDETLEDRQRQWDYLKNRLFLASGLTCDYCQNFRHFETEDDKEHLTHDQYCLTCHTGHHDHPEESPGTNCTICHQPTRTRDGTAYSIHDHRFSYDTPPGP